MEENNNSSTTNKTEEVFEGTVKWFNNTKGFGFIEHIDGSDVFVHFSVIEKEGFKTVKDGEAVRYSLEKGEKGFHATMVRPLEGAAIDASKDSTASTLASRIDVEETMSSDSKIDSETTPEFTAEPPRSSTTQPE